MAVLGMLTFLMTWNDFFWPSLMLPTPANKTLPVGLVALQGFFSSEGSAPPGLTLTNVDLQ